MKIKMSKKAVSKIIIIKVFNNNKVNKIKVNKLNINSQYKKVVKCLKIIIKVLYLLKNNNILNLIKQELIQQSVFLMF